MSGSNNGTGQPITFRCSACRKAGRRLGGFSGDVDLTGAMADVHHGRIGIRTMPFRLGYKCRTCGHVGTSCHLELAGMAVSAGLLERHGDVPCRSKVRRPVVDPDA